MNNLTRFLRRTLPQHVIRSPLSSQADIVPRVAVVGAGPAGFYASQQIVKARDDVVVDIYEKLPVPFGLVRFGVAPDHPEVKNCINQFNKTMENPRVNFFGNVALGSDVSLEQLRSNYHAVLLTYGAEEDRLLGVPGEDLDNVLAARSLVSLYNGFPGHQDLKVNLDTETAMVIGIGNVSVDIVRMLLTSVDDLRKTDCTDAWLDQLSKSRVKRVVMVGRRGPLQVSFTVAELRELVKLAGCRTVMHESQYQGVREVIGKIPRKRKRLTELMVKTALKETEEKLKKSWLTAEKEWELNLFRSPLRFEGDSSLEKVVLGVNKQVGGVLGEGVEATDEEEVVECGLVLRSIGYKSIQADHSLPFDKTRGIVPNDMGRVTSIPGLYVGGWLGTGPRGVIADTQSHAFAVGSALAADLPVKVEHKSGWEGVAAEGGVAAQRHASWGDWELLDRVEVERGKGLRPRSKLTEVEDMLEVMGK